MNRSYNYAVGSPDTTLIYIGSSKNGYDDIKRIQQHVAISPFTGGYGGEGSIVGARQLSNDYMEEFKHQASAFCLSDGRNA